MKRNKLCAKIICAIFGHNYTKMWRRRNGVANKITICSRCKKRSNVLDEPFIDEIYIAKE